jgi:hypothetical protein
MTSHTPATRPAPTYSQDIRYIKVIPNKYHAKNIIQKTVIKKMLLTRKKSQTATSATTLAGDGIGRHGGLSQGGVIL